MIQEDMNFAIENTLLLSGGGLINFSPTFQFSELLLFLGGGGDLYHEQYNEHGVKIENQCFP